MSIKTCCCCFSLRSGAFIIGILCLIFGILQFLVSTYILARGMEAITDQVPINLEDLITKQDDFGYNLSLQVHLIKEEVAWYLVLGSAVASGVYTMLCILMIHGARTEKRHFMLPWMAWTLLSQMFSVGSSVAVLVLSEFKLLYIIILVIVVVIFCVWLYFLISIINFYRDLKRHQEREQEHTIPMQPKY